MNKYLTSEAVNMPQTGKIELEVSALELIKEKLIMLERGERMKGRQDVFRELEEIFKAKDTFKGHVYFDDLGDLIHELRQRLK